MTTVKIDYSNARPVIRPRILPDDGPSRAILANAQARAASAFNGYSIRAQLLDDIRDAEADLQSAIAQGHTDERILGPLRERVDIAKKALAQHDAQVGPLTARGHADQVQLGNLARFLNGIAASGKKLKNRPVVVPEDADMGTLMDEIGPIDAEISETEVSRLPVSLAIQTIRNRIESMADHGAPRAAVREELSGPHATAKLRSVVDLDWPMRRLEAAPLDNGDLPHTVDVAAVLCWLGRDEILAKAESDLEDAYRDYTGIALSPDEKRARLAELRDQKLAKERILAALIWQRIEAGEDISFPANLAPEAVLGVAVA